MDFAAGTFLGDGDRDGPRARAHVEHDAGVSPGIYEIQGCIDDALGIGARDQGVLVQIEDEVPEVRVAKDALHRLALQAAGDPGLVQRRLLVRQGFFVEGKLGPSYAEQFRE